MNRNRPFFNIMMLAIMACMLGTATAVKSCMGDIYADTCNASCLPGTFIGTFQGNSPLLGCDIAGTLMKTNALINCQKDGLCGNISCGDYKVVNTRPFDQNVILATPRTKCACGSQAPSGREVCTAGDDIRKSNLFGNKVLTELCHIKCIKDQQI